MLWDAMVSSAIWNFEPMSANELREAWALIQEWMAIVLTRPSCYPELLPDLLRAQALAISILSQRSHAHTAATPPRIDVAELKRHIDLVALVRAECGGLTVTKEVHDRVVIRCPFPDHEDRTPSFNIYSDDHWYCYGCNRGGDAFTFLMFFHGISFKEALLRLAGEAHHTPRGVAPNETLPPDGAAPVRGRPRRGR
jgi:hypothetical protein